MEVLEATDKKKKITPKLRFKGFKDIWSKKTLFDISENVSYGMNAAATEFDGIHKYIRITDIDVNTGEFKPDPLTSPLGDIDERFKLREGDIVFARTGASVGKSHLYNPKDGALYYAGFLIKFSITNANPYFIYSLTLRGEYNRWVHIYSMRSGQPGLNAEEYKALKLNIPSLPEQQKIASFLSVVDEKILQLTRKKELLEQYKKGVMQQLFSGKLRFRDEKGKAYPKWEEKRLGDALDYIQPTKYLVDNTEYDDSYSTPVLTAGKTFILGYTNETKNIFNQNLPVIIFDDFTTATQFVDFPFKAKSSAMKILVAKENENIKYLYEAMRLIKFEIGGHGRHWISQFALFNIPYPCKEEQQKISDYLSHLDKKIDATANQITQTQTFKKGLLQQMFV